MKLGIFGATLQTDRALCSYGKEIILAAAGPLTNLLCFALCLVSDAKSETAELFKLASLVLAILNLLPISELDGGRIVYCTLASSFSVECAKRVVDALSFAIIFSLWTLSVYLILRLGASLSLFVFSCFLFGKIFIKNTYEI
jgi:stage IV sporulation protein FB